MRVDIFVTEAKLALLPSKQARTAAALTHHIRQHRAPSRPAIIIYLLCILHYFISEATVRWYTTRSIHITYYYILRLLSRVLKHQTARGPLADPPAGSTPPGYYTTTTYAYSRLL